MIGEDILTDAECMLLLKRGIRAFALGGVALLLSVMQAHFNYWDLVSFAVVAVLATTVRTLPVALAIIGFLAALYLFPPEMAANVAAWIKSVG